MPPRAGEVSGAAPSFFWQVDHHEARRFIEQNPWFAGMPFLMLESATPGAARLEVDGMSPGEIHRRCFELFVMRHCAMRRPTTFSVRDDATFRPLRRPKPGRQSSRHGLWHVRPAWRNTPFASLSC